MAEKRSPRNLRDISHLFLSGERAGPRPEARREPVSIWLAAAGTSTNRAHLAAGLAAALSRQGMCVSLAEACRGLPDIGFYFGLEPEAHLAPALHRGALETGTWNGSIRFCFSGSLPALARYRGEALPPAAPHAVLVAFAEAPERRAAAYLAGLRTVSAVLAGDGDGSARSPDAIIAAGCGASARRAAALTVGMRDAYPEAAVFLLSDDPGARRLCEPEGIFVLSPELRSSWARRLPPVDRLFDEVAAGLLQVVSLKRKRGTAHAADAS